MDDTAIGNSPRTLISKITSSKRTRLSKDDSLAEIRQRLATMSNPAEQSTPRTLIRNILDANDIGPSSSEANAIAPRRRSHTKTRKSQSPKVTRLTRAASKTVPQSAKLAESAHNSSDTLDSFVLPRYRTRRRQIRKKERRKPTKADMEAFAAGAEALLAAEEFLPTSESETDVSVASSAARQVSTLGSSSEANAIAPRRRSHTKTRKSQSPKVTRLTRAASKTVPQSAKLAESAHNSSDTLDSFVLPRYRTRRRQIRKKERRKPTKADMEALAAGAEALLAAEEFLPTSESETDVSVASSAARQVSTLGSSSEANAIAPRRRSHTKTRKSQSPKVTRLTRAASKTVPQSAKLAESAHNSSDTLDSFVLPRYRTRRRQIRKKERRKPTKADMEAFAAGAEALLAAEEFLPTSESETDVSVASSAARQVSTLGNTFDDSYAADSFVLPPYNAGRRILKKKRRVPGPDEARAFAKAVDEIKDDGGDWTTTDESFTDLRREELSIKELKSPKRSLQNADGSAKLGATKYSTRKRLSQDVNIEIETSHKSPSASVAQKETSPKNILASKTDMSQSSGDEDSFIETGNLNFAGSTSKQKLPRKMVSKRDTNRSHVSDSFVAETTSRDITSSPNYSGAPFGQRISRSGNKANVTTQDAATGSKKRSMQFSIDFPRDYENHGFSPKLSSTRMTVRRSLSFHEEFSNRPAPNTNQRSRLSTTFQQSDVVENPTSSRRSTPSSRMVASNAHSNQSPFGHEPAKGSVSKSGFSVRNKPEFNNSADKRSSRSHEHDNHSQEMLAPSSPLRLLPMQSPQKNKSMGSDHVLRLTVSPRSSLSFQEEFYTRPALRLKENSSQSVIQATQSSSAARTNIHFKQSKFVHEEIEESMIKGGRSGSSNLKADSSASKNVSLTQPSPKNKSAGYQRVSLLVESPRSSLSIQKTFHPRSASRLSEHSEQSGNEENDLMEDLAFSSSPRRSSRIASPLPLVHEQVEKSSKKDDLSVRGKSNVGSFTRKKADDSLHLPTQSSTNKSKSFHGASLLSDRETPNLSGKTDFKSKTASRLSEHSEQSGNEENDLMEDLAFSSSPRRSSRIASPLPLVHEQVEKSSKKDDLSARGKSNVGSFTRKKADDSLHLPTQSSTNKSKSFHGASLLSDRETPNLSGKTDFKSKTASRLSEHSEQSGNEENDLMEDLAFSSSPRRSSRIASPLPLVHEQVEKSSKKDDLSVRGKSNVGSFTRKKADDSLHLPTQSSTNKSKSFHGASLLSDRETPNLSGKTDFKKSSSSRRSLMQSHLVFSPKNSGKLRYSNPATSQVTDSKTDGSKREVRVNESLASVGRKLKDIRRRRKDSPYSGDSNSDTENKKSTPSRNTAKPSTSQRNDSLEDNSEQEISFRSRKRSVPHPEYESDSTYIRKKRLKVIPKAKNSAKGGHTARKPQVNEEFVPLSGTKANFEHFLQKRVIRPTAIEVQKHVNRFFKMTRDEMEKIMARKPANKKYISPTEVKNMFIKQGLFESLDHLEMNARQWLDSDGQEMVVDYQGAFQNIKYF